MATRLENVTRIWFLLVCTLCTVTPVIAQPAPMLVLQADLLVGENVDGAPPTAIGLTGGVEWQRAAFAIGVKTTLLYSASTARGRLPSDVYRNVLEAFPHLDVGIRVLERDRVRLSAIGAAGPWINVASRSRNASGRLRAFQDVEYRAVAASAGVELCWRINPTGRRVCGAGSTLHYLPGFGIRDGGFIGPLLSISLK